MFDYFESHFYCQNKKDLPLSFSVKTSVTFDTFTLKVAANQKYLHSVKITAASTKSEQVFTCFRIDDAIRDEPDRS